MEKEKKSNFNTFLQYILFRRNRNAVRESSSSATSAITDRPLSSLEIKLKDSYENGIKEMISKKRNLNINDNMPVPITRNMLAEAKATKFVSSEALSFIADSLIKLNRNLVKGCKNSTRRTEIMYVSCACKVVEEKFPPNLRNMAFSHGKHMLTSYVTGVLEYIPPKMPKFAKKKKKNLMKQIQHPKEVSVISNAVHPVNEESDNGIQSDSNDSEEQPVGIYQDNSTFLVENPEDLSDDEDALETLDTLLAD